MSSFVHAPLPLAPAPRARVNGSVRSTVHMIASLLLDYPDEVSFTPRLDASAQALATTEAPRVVAAPLEEFILTAHARGQRAMAEHYVEVFDRRRRCCLYLSYYTVGDTRHRGAAVLAFKQALAASGFEMARDELPDYLPVVLELSARGGGPVAEAVLCAHREGIEVLRSALTDLGSPYARLVDAVSSTLPDIDESTLSRIRALVAAGPPTETVGVTGHPLFPTVSPSGSPRRTTLQEVRP